MMKIKRMRWLIRFLFYSLVMGAVSSCTFGCAPLVKERQPDPFEFMLRIQQYNDIKTMLKKSSQQAAGSNEVEKQVQEYLDDKYSLKTENTMCVPKTREHDLTEWEIEE